MGRRVRTVGIISVWAGIVLLLNSFIGVTGYAIASSTFLESMDLFKPGFLVGVVFLVIGFLMMSSRDESQLVSKAGINIGVTDKFRKAIKKHNPDDIYRGLERIGTGLGHEEKLRGQEEKYSIRTSKGGRVIFHYNDAHDQAIVDDFTPDHKYDEVLRNKKKRRVA